MATLLARMGYSIHCSFKMKMFWTFLNMKFKVNLNLKYFNVELAAKPEINVWASWDYGSIDRVKIIF